MSVKTEHDARIDDAKNYIAEAITRLNYVTFCRPDEYSEEYLNKLTLALIELVKISGILLGDSF